MEYDGFYQQPFILKMDIIRQITFNFCSHNAKTRANNILIIDEDIGHCEQLAKTLSESKMTATYVNDGIEALKKIKDQSFDIAICDINIPKKDGYEVYREKCNSLLLLLIPDSSFNIMMKMKSI